jgi:hypothetical protein
LLSYHFKRPAGRTTYFDSKEMLTSQEAGEGNLEGTFVVRLSAKKIFPSKFITEIIKETITRGRMGNELVYKGKEGESQEKTKRSLLFRRRQKAAFPGTGLIYIFGKGCLLTAQRR